MIFLCLVINLDAQQNASAETYEIGGIKVSGLQASERQAILAIAGLRIGDKITIRDRQIEVKTII